MFLSSLMFTTVVICISLGLTVEDLIVESFNFIQKWVAKSENLDTDIIEESLNISQKDDSTSTVEDSSKTEEATRKEVYKLGASLILLFTLSVTIA